MRSEHPGMTRWVRREEKLERGRIGTFATMEMEIAVGGEALFREPGPVMDVVMHPQVPLRERKKDSFSC